MDYMPFAYEGDNVYCIKSVKIRSDAKIETVYKKLAFELVREIKRRGVHVNDPFIISYDLPNVWRNGAVGSVWMTAGNDFYEVYSFRDGVPWL